MNMNINMIMNVKKIIIINQKIKFIMKKKMKKKLIKKKKKKKRKRKAKYIKK